VAFDHWWAAQNRKRQGAVFLFTEIKRRVSRWLVSLNGWDGNKTHLQKDEHGMWRVAIDAPPPGLYHYKYVVNGEWWLEDPNNGMKAPEQPRRTEFSTDHQVKNGFHPRFV